ncbi:MAG: transf 3 protein [Bacteroidetes bacterium]|nr:transf 3 protein [Bacteroidota bacterium]
MEAVRSMCGAVFIHAVNITGLPWVEMDFPFDVDRAQKKVWPAIQKDKWKQSVHWRITRWIVLAVAAVLLVSTAVLVTLSLQSQGVEWTTIEPVESNEVLLPLPKGTQKWWAASHVKPLRVLFTGPSFLRAEFRLLVTSESALPGRYAVQVSLDGKPAHWEVFRATRDTEAALPGFIVGDRDRYEFEILEGHHVIEISLLGGISDSMLVRIRNPEFATPEDDEENQ